MITAKNYAAQAERGIANFISTGMENGFLNDVDKLLLNQFVDGVKDSVHFCLPDNGKLLNDAAKGIRSELLRLPYKSITIEYYVNGDMYDPGNKLLTADYPKRVVLAREVDANLFRQFDVKGMIRNIKDDVFIVVFSACADSNGVWVPDPLGFAVRQKWDNVESAQMIQPLVNKTIKGVDFAGLPIPLCPSLIELSIANYGEELGIRHLMHNISLEVRAVIELCEALSCKNVEPSLYQKSANNKKRIAKGKLPIYETKNLVVRSSSKKYANSSPANYDRNSPRQHLRRGHIRRLEAGNIWVNSCVVGDQDLGVIDKTYFLK